MNMPKTRQLIKKLFATMGSSKTARLLQMSTLTIHSIINKNTEIRKAQAQKIVNNVDVFLSELSDLLVDAQNEYFYEHGDAKNPPKSLYNNK